MFRFIATCSVALLVSPGVASAQVAHPITPEQKIQNALSAAPQGIAEGENISLHAIDAAWAALWGWKVHAPTLAGLEF